MLHIVYRGGVFTFSAWHNCVFYLWCVPHTDNIKFSTLRIYLLIQEIIVLNPDTIPLRFQIPLRHWVRQNPYFSTITEFSDNSKPPKIPHFSLPNSPQTLINSHFSRTHPHQFKNRIKTNQKTTIQSVNLTTLSLPKITYNSMLLDNPILKNFNRNFELHRTHKN